MKSKDKLIIFAVLIFVVVGLIAYVYDDNVCDPEWENIEKNLDYIKTPNSIKKIELLSFDSNSDLKLNLTGDTIVLADNSVIEKIRTMVNERNLGTWNRPTATWNVEMRMTFDNGKTFDFQISKISNDENSDMTHIYFGSNHCKDNTPTYSLTLGSYLEELTDYKQVND
jgi:hypothetical protein